MRLAVGVTEREGRVEVCVNYLRWLTVCDEQWLPGYTAIPCRYFGFAEEGEHMCMYSTRQ